MALRSWPFGVTSWDDTVKFAQLLFGVDVAVQDYGHRLPHSSNKSFLLFAKGACAEGKPFSEIATRIPAQLAEIEQWEPQRGNVHRPTKSQQMLKSGGRTVHYWSAQVTRAPCVCRTFFGADAHQKHVPTSSAVWNTASRFAKLWDATLMKNYSAFQNRDLRPVWLDKSWQVLWNWNDHNANHGIEPHSDLSSTYSLHDPITSLSFGHGGVLTLGTKKKKAEQTKMLFQEGGDVLIMAGDFQAEFQHGVPPRSEWDMLTLKPMFTAMEAWEKAGVMREMVSREKAPPGVKHVRMNCTVRWHNTHHEGCPAHTADAGRTPGTAASVAAPAAARTQGTQPVVTGAVRESAASMVEGQMPALVGIKKRGAEEESTPSVSTRKTPRSGNSELLQERSDEVIAQLLDCLATCLRQNDIFALAITGAPLVQALPKHAEIVASIDENVKELRDRLQAAAEAAQEFSHLHADRVSFTSLNLIELAAQQRRSIHKHLGNFYTTENASWLIETPIKIPQNCLKKEMQYRKRLLSHRHLELLLECLCANMMHEHHEIAFDLSRLQRGVFPLKFACAKRHPQAKQHQHEDLGLDAYDFASDSVLLLKALEVGYVKDLEKATRLQTVTGSWKKLPMSVGEIIESLRAGLLTMLQHLRAMDSGKRFRDRTSGTLASENYDIWVWLAKAKP